MKEELVTIDEARNKYPEEWVLMELVKFDRWKNPKAGTIVCHSPDPDNLVEPEKSIHEKD
ncbi:MAG: hypothetical protein HW403_650 [Dehalococcoidia bacterium]|nr:hypothetical protein [Dehalococcoidia bacterium]